MDERESSESEIVDIGVPLFGCRSSVEKASSIPMGRAARRGGAGAQRALGRCGIPSGKWGKIIFKIGILCFGALRARALLARSARVMARGELRTEN